MNDEAFSYVGQELEVFALAGRWKNYVLRSLTPSIQGRVLEVGAGIGATTRVLSAIPHRDWVALEPDDVLLATIRAAIEKGELPPSVTPRLGTTQDLGEDGTFDTVIYIDVLEHIAEDRDEVARAAAKLRPGGRLVVLSPAFQTLFSPFDAAIGHYRRYTRRTLAALTPPQLKLRTSFYLDACGAGLSLANRLLLRQSMPTADQIRTWDRFVIPVSEVVDKALRGVVGRSVVAVWERV